MAPNVKQLIAAGFERLHYGMLDSSGFLIGGTSTPPGAGSAAGSPMARLLGVKTMDLAIAEPESVTITGDDISQGIFIFPAATLPSFTIEAGVADLSADALFQETLVDAFGDISFGALQPTDPGFPDVSLLGISRSKSKASGSDGVAQYQGVFIPKATIIPLGQAGFTERGAISYKWKVTANPADKLASGAALSNTTLGTTAAPILPWSAENRITWHRATGNAVLTAFTLLYTPVAPDQKVHVWVDGIKKTVTTDYTVDEGTKTVTFTTAPANNTKIVFLYEYVP